MGNYYSSVIGSVFKFDSNGNLLVNMETMPAFKFDNDGNLLVNMSGSVSGGIHLLDSSDNVINPAIREIQSEIRDQLSLPNEDYVVSTSPSALTEYSAKIETSRAIGIVISLFCDVTPQYVKVEGSTDDIAYYEIDGIEIDVTTWNTDKYNIYRFEPYTKYIKVTLKTSSTAPSRVEVYVKGIRG